jgi:hypothetical protein
MLVGHILKGMLKMIQIKIRHAEAIINNKVFIIIFLKPNAKLEQRRLEGKKADKSKPVFQTDTLKIGIALGV